MSQQANSDPAVGSVPGSPNAAAAPPDSAPDNGPLAEYPQPQLFTNSEPAVLKLHGDAASQLAAHIPLAIDELHEILARVERVPRMKKAMETVLVADSGGKTFLDVLQDSVAKRGLDVQLIRGLWGTTWSLLRDTQTTSGMKSRKRKRDDEVTVDDTLHTSGPRRSPGSVLSGEGQPSIVMHDPPHFLTGQELPPPIDMLIQIDHAIAIVHGVLTHSEVQGVPLDTQTVASILGPLHEVFLFVATSTVAPRTDDVTTLQEISGLIQILGILHNVVITPSNTVKPLARAHHNIHNSGTPLPVRHLQSIQSNFKDIGTAVYPCLYPSCGKTFIKLSHLRKHETLAHVTGKPFKCDRCSATFARKYDLTRHEKSHDTVVFQCSGCSRKFTRRDALKRHKSNVKSAEACRSGKVEEVQADLNDVHASSRRVKASPGPGLHRELEEGELPMEALARAQSTVKVLHPLLQRHVTAKLPQGTGPGRTSTSSVLAEYNLNPEQTLMLERAIAAASEAARVQAELEARMELDEEGSEDGSDDGELVAQGP